MLELSLISMLYTKVIKINQKERIMKTVLDIHGLSKNFDKQAILQDLHLMIREGDIYGLIGKNGAGKTTLIKIITQLLFADKGTVSLFSSQSENEWTKALSRVGSVIT